MLRCPVSPCSRILVGGYTARVTPVPIPNTVVKPRWADGTAREIVWESTTSPAFDYPKARIEPLSRCGLFALPRAHDRGPGTRERERATTRSRAPGCGARERDPTPSRARARDPARTRIRYPLPGPGRVHAECTPNRLPRDPPYNGAP